jgi:hypothetical protein
VCLAAVVLTHHLLDSLGGFISVVEWNGADIVVADVGLDDSMEQLATDKSEFAVNRCCSTTGEVPGLVVVVRQGRIGVLQESDGHWEIVSKHATQNRPKSILLLTKPVVNPEIRHSIPHKQVEPAESGSKIIQTSTDKTQSQVTEKNELGILGLVQRAARVKVVDTAKTSVLLALTTTLDLALVVVVASHVGEEVYGPAEKLLQNQVHGSENRGFLHEFRNLVDSLADVRGILLASLGYEDHIAAEVTGGFVVLAVGDLPGKVRHQEGRVKDPANGVVENFGRRESLVAAFVSQNPHSSAEKTLHESVQSPQTRAQVDIGHGLRGHIIVEEVESGREAGKVPKDIVQTGGWRPLKAMRRNGIADLLDCVVGDLELVA